MVVVGIDADTRQVAYSVCRDGSVVAVGTIERETVKGFAVADYDQRLTVLVRKAQDAGAVVYLEDTFLAGDGQRNVTTLKRLAEVGGEIKAAARKHGVPVRSVMASEWRAEVLGATAGRDRLKALARSRAEQAVPNRLLTEHECEAVCIGQYAARAERGD